MTIAVFKPQVAINGSPSFSEESLQTPTSLLQLKQRIQDQVVAIGATDPHKASEISHRVIRCNWTTREIDALRDQGLQLEDFSSPARLLGGGVEDLAASIAKAILAPGVKLLVEGNKEEMDTEVGKAVVTASIILPDGTEEKGTHTGERKVEKKGNRFYCCWPTYEIEASGKGAFRSKRVTYKGDFFENLFHDQTGTAQYFVDSDVRYTGSFMHGKRHGHGKLEKYDVVKSKWYPQFEGSWHEDRPLKGELCTSNGERKHYEDFSYASKDGYGSASHYNGFSPSERNPQTPSDKEDFTRPLLVRVAAAPSAKSTDVYSDPGPYSPVTPLQYPTPEENPLIKAKLKNPSKKLNVEESISLLTQCIRYGEIQSHKAQDKELLIFIGNTGAGKSTTSNYLAGCTLVSKSPKELGLKGLQNVLVVVPPEQGGRLAEIMPIGHTKESKTFMPQIETPAGSSITFCDCPGFLDNRGAEINIANAVNIRAALRKAKGVKVLVLINYHSLLADRGRGLTEMLKICSNLFGTTERLIHHKDALLIGVTQAPSEMELQNLKEWITDDKLPLMTTLTERLFTFDPIDRSPSSDRWSREELIQHIQQLTPIKNPGKIFSTVLTDEDETALIRISEEIGRKIDTSLQGKNYPDAALHLHQLEELSVIDHITIERLLQQSRKGIEQKIQEIITQFTNHCNFERFEQAKTLLESFPQALRSFPFLKISIQDLQRYFNESQDKYNKAIAREQEFLNQIKEVNVLLEKQKQITKQKLEEQERKYTQLLQDLQGQIGKTQSDYEQVKTKFQQEMEARFAKKSEELSHVVGQSRQELAASVAQERLKLQKEYEEKLRLEEAKHKAQIQEQQAAQLRVKTESEAEKARLELELKKLTAAQAQKAQEALPLNSPRFFGAEDWKKYFGNVGEVPPLPKDINEILKSRCPIWPDKRVEETHTLALVPSSVNGKPLTLDSLGELVQHPQGGKETKYRHYWDAAKKEIGQTPAPASHWVLMTTDVLPNTRSQRYDAQVAQVKKYSGYEVPKALEAAVAILMGYVKTGIGWYTESPWTYTRCQEKVEGYQVTLGGLGSSGLAVISPYYPCAPENFGVGALRKFRS